MALKTTRVFLLIIIGCFVNGTKALTATFKRCPAKTSTTFVPAYVRNDDLVTMQSSKYFKQPPFCLSVSNEKLLISEVSLPAQNQASCLAACTFSPDGCNIFYLAEGICNYGLISDSSMIFASGSQTGESKTSVMILKDRKPIKAKGQH